MKHDPYPREPGSEEPRPSERRPSLHAHSLPAHRLPAPEPVLDELGARQNLQRLLPATLILVPIILGHIVYCLLTADPALAPARLIWRQALAGVHTATLIVLSTLAGLSVSVWRRPASTSPLRWRASLPVAFATLFVVSTAALATVDQLVTNAITPYITASLGVALLLRLNTRETLGVYALGLVAIIVGVAFVQPVMDARISVDLNAVTVTGVSAAISISLTRALLLAEEAKRTIAAQTSEIDRLRNFLRVCSWCKRVANEREEWEAADRFIARSRGVDITHGICEDCHARMFAEDDDASA
jgi:hypothetical protein